MKSGNQDLKPGDQNVQITENKIKRKEMEEIHERE